MDLMAACGVIVVVRAFVPAERPDPPPGQLLEVDRPTKPRQKLLVLQYARGTTTEEFAVRGDAQQHIIKSWPSLYYYRLSRQPTNPRSTLLRRRDARNRSAKP